LVKYCGDWDEETNVLPTLKEFRFDGDTREESIRVSFLVIMALVILRIVAGDEPLLLPRHLDALVDSIILKPKGDAWNATAPIENIEELDRHSFVKCAVNIKNNIMFCFRRTPLYSPFESQTTIIRKILGLIAYEKNFLIKLTTLEPSPIETVESVEQMRMIENGYEVTSVAVSPSLPSVNEPAEAEIVLNYIENNMEQKDLLNKILAF
jgi:3-deoxy-manno-octulosonate cytidylyltransferase (CMP-KDO synthetase)